MPQAPLLAFLAALAAVLAPAAGALLLTLAPAAPPGRLASRVAASVTLAAVLTLAGATGAGAAGVGAWAGAIWHPDRLAVALSMLVAALQCAAVWGVAETPPEAARRLACLAAMMLAVLADAILASWLGVYLAALAILHGGPSARLPALGGLATALFGTVLLAVAATPAVGTGLGVLSWDALGRAARSCDGRLLSLAFAVVMAGYGAVAMTAVSAGISAITLLAVLAGIVLRLRGVLAGSPDAMASTTLLVGGGLWLLAHSIAALWLSRARSDPRVHAMRGQIGVALVAFGLGGQGPQAGLIHMTTIALAAAAAVTGGGLARRAGIAALAMVPPFGPFAGAALILVAAARAAPWLGVVLALGLVTLSVAVLRRLPRRPAPAGTRAADAVAWLELAAGVLLGLAMPASVAAWFAAAASGPP